MRGAIGDLVILNSIVNGLMKRKRIKKVNLVVTGPVNKETIHELYQISTLNYNSLDYYKSNTSSGLEFQDSWIRAYEKRTGCTIDIALNHVSSDSNGLKILEADEICPFVPRDYSSVKYHPSNLIIPWKKYVLICPFGGSNPRWKSDRAYEYYQKIVDYFIKETDYTVVFAGKWSDDTPEGFGNFNVDKSDKLRVRYIYNNTTIGDMIALIRGSEIGVYFDSGIKNLAFIHGNKNMVVYDDSHRNARPAEAWFPPQFHTPDNIYLNINKGLENREDYLRKIMEDFI